MIYKVSEQFCIEETERFRDVGESQKQRAKLSEVVPTSKFSTEKRSKRYG
jgi:hypothetical protein